MVGVLQAVHGVIVVCERQPYWTPALQRELLTDPYSVRGCQSPREIDGLIVAHRAAIVVFDLDADPAGCLVWLAARMNRPVSTILCGSPTTAELEPLCRELGAMSFLPDLISRTEMAALCRRWMASNTA